MVVAAVAVTVAVTVTVAVAVAILVAITVAIFGVGRFGDIHVVADQTGELDVQLQQAVAEMHENRLGQVEEAGYEYAKGNALDTSYRGLRG